MKALQERKDEAEGLVDFFLGAISRVEKICKKGDRRKPIFFNIKELASCIQFSFSHFHQIKGGKGKTGQARQECVLLIEHVSL